MKSRDEIKLQMIKDRGGIDFYDMCLCDLCQLRRAVQMHERIKRSQTIAGSEARELSFQKTLCNLLCLECHAIADTIEVDKKLWEFSAKLYGTERMIEAIDRLQTVTRRRLIIEWLDEVGNW